MVIFVAPGDLWDYTLREDRDEPDACVFQLSCLSEKQERKVAKMPAEECVAYALAECQGLGGWLGMRDYNGNPVEFPGAAKALDGLSAKTRGELFEAVLTRGGSIDKADRD